MYRHYLFSSESVSAGHPDKLADQISDAILDCFLKQDSNARVACETLIADDLIVISGEFGTDVSIFNNVRGRIPSLVREVLLSVGYRSDFPGINPDSCQIQLNLNQQSPDIARGVDLSDNNTGAGDQGLMFGYASDETSSLMPLPISLAHKLMQRHGELRQSGALPWLRPDAKAQVSVRYVGIKPVGVETVVLSTQHQEDIDSETLRDAVIGEIIEPVIGKQLLGSQIQFLVNPTGKFVIGGPKGDTGLTGRKIIVDTYGGSCPHGGGAFSGKDPTKVDRSAAYMARFIARNIVSAGLSRRSTVQLAYAIGVSKPVSVYINLHGTGNVDETILENIIRERFDLSVAGIIQSLDLKRPIYQKTSNYGHFGRKDPAFTWEAESDVLKDLRFYGWEDK